MTSPTTHAPTSRPPHWLNRVMAGALKTPGLQRVIGKNLALLTVTGVKSGNRYTIPVTYRRHGQTVTMMTKATNRWWRNLRSNPTVGLRLSPALPHRHGPVRPGAARAETLRRRS